MNTLVVVKVRIITISEQTTVAKLILYRMAQDPTQCNNAAFNHKDIDPCLTG